MTFFTAIVASFTRAIPLFVRLTAIYALVFAGAIAGVVGPQTAPVAPRPEHVGPPPVPTCGLVCGPKATITISLTTGWDFPLQGQVAWADYQVKNISPNTLQGVVSVTLNGKVMSDANPHNVILAEGQSYNGQVWIADPPAGDVTLHASYVEPLKCLGPVKYDPAYPYKIPCLFGTLWGEQDAGGTVYPDGDKDGFGDNFENQLLQTYAPLLLFSWDHNSEEKYAPIDVIDFIKGSTLVSKEGDALSIGNTGTLSANPGIILNPTNVPATQDQIGTINPLQQPLSSSQPDLLPRMIYVSPSDKTQKGTDWSTVMASQNTGLYGHVLVLNVSEIANNANQPFKDAVAQSENQVLAKELSNIYCNGDDPSTCTASVIRIEYWQFFGYSHDFDDPVPGTSWLAADVVDHGGDWCSVQLYVDFFKAFSQPDQAILAVYHYAHGLRFGFDMQRGSITSQIGLPSGSSSSLGPIFQQFVIKQLQGNAFSNGTGVSFSPFNADNKTVPQYQNAQNNVLQIAQDPKTVLFVHPVVYVEWGGHEFWPSAAWSFVGASKHGGDSKKYHYIATAPLNVGEVGNPMPQVPQAPFVTGFAGFWGYYGWENQNKPPPGPPLHAEWLWYPGTDPALLKLRPTQSLPPW